jgi:hypothetical protein
LTGRPHGIVTSGTGGVTRSKFSSHDFGIREIAEAGSAKVIDRLVADEGLPQYEFDRVRAEAARSLEFGHEQVARPPQLVVRAWIKAKHERASVAVITHDSGHYRG